jgi:hypothetical protein
VFVGGRAFHGCGDEDHEEKGDERHRLAYKLHTRTLQKLTNLHTSQTNNKTIRRNNLVLRTLRALQKLANLHKWQTNNKITIRNNLVLRT